MAIPLILTVIIAVGVVWPATIEFLARERCEGPVRRNGKSVTCTERGTGKSVTLGDIQLAACCPGAVLCIGVLGVILIVQRVLVIKSRNAWNSEFR